MNIIVLHQQALTYLASRSPQTLMLSFLIYIIRLVTLQGGAFAIEVN